MHKTWVYRVWALVWLTSSMGAAMAQNTSVRGRFEVDYIKGCAPLTVQVNALQNLTLAKTYRYEGRQSQEREETTYEYTQPGIYYIWELTASTDFDSIRVEVVPNTPPNFEIYTCANRAAQIAIQNSQYDTYEVDYTQDGTPQYIVPNGQPVPSYDYGALGDFTITVRGQDNNAAANCQPLSRSFTTLDVLPIPQITQSLVLSANELQLNYALQPNIYYQLELAVQNNPAFSVNGKLEENSNSLVLDNLNNEGNFYRFRIGTVDVCNNSIQHSEVVSSIRLQLSIQNNLNRLQWVTNTSNFTGYQLARNEVANYGVPGLSETQFDDVNIICGTPYCYTLTATYTNGATSISATRCGEAISNDVPAAITDFSASVSASQIDLNWEAPNLFHATSYSVYRGEEPGSILRFVGNSSTPSFTSLAAEESPTCFRIDYMDQCGNLSEPGRQGCTIFLSGTGLSTSISLQWTPYTGWQNGPTEYLVEKYVNNQLIGTFTAGTNTSYVDAEDDPTNQVVVYVIRAISPLAGLPDVLSNVLVFIKAPVITFPSAFTPDGNALNDEFKVIGRYISQYELKIFNRWGEMLFITQNPEEGWDGLYRGKPLPQGSYLYKVEIVDFTGARHVRDGQVMLLRTRQ